MKEKRRYAILLSASLGCVLCSACGPANPAPGIAAEKTPVAHAAPVETIKARIFESRVDEKNLLLKSEESAKSYLRRKLVGVLEKKLTELGFDFRKAESLATGGKLDDFHVRGHAEKIPGQGREKGKIVRAVLWDAHGGLVVSLSDADVADLGADLETLPVNSLDGAAKVAEYLIGYRALKPDKARLLSLEEKVADRWAGLLDAFLKVQQETSLADPQRYFKMLSESIGALCTFSAHNPRHEKFSGLEKIVTLSALRWLHTVSVTADNHGRIRQMLARLTKICLCALPDMTAFLRRDLELSWRDRLNKLDAAKASFPELKQDFIFFLKDFPGSDFYPELELRFLSRWIDYLQARRAENIEQLDDFASEVELLGKRFPSFSERGGVEAALGRQCLEVLSRVKVPDLKTLAGVKKTLARCDRFLPAGMSTMSARQRLEGIENELLEAREDRRERKALSGLAFFIHWDEAIKKLAWGHARKDWVGSGAFAKAWAAGHDAGADCRCSLDADDPCRLFDEDGPHGGYEVVGRFVDDRLGGVDICEAYAGSNTAAVYKFFDRRYQKAHGAKESAAFLAGAGRQVRFGRMSKMVVDLRCAGGTCSVRYRDGKVLRKKHEQDGALKSAQHSARKQARLVRVEKGWQQRDCVKWDCDYECQYQGEIFERKGKRYLVTVKRSDEEPRSVGTRVWVKAGELYDCK
ncbi:MAG TPA: hypothetical protein VM425_12295 [Myxococcota bacterium]|nr:hypothetical protein [Myxococcota bacterium]